MAEMLSPSDLFAFAIIFFPGFISLCIVLRLHEVSLKSIGAVEKIVASYALSVICFLIARIPLNPLAPSLDVLTPGNLTLTFLAAILLGLIVATGYYGWLYIEAAIAMAGGWVKSRFGLTIVPGPALKRSLDLFWKNRLVSYVVVTDKEGRTFRGFLGIWSLNPRLEIMLVRHHGKNPEKLDQEAWKPVDQWALVFTDENIRSLGSMAM